MPSDMNNDETISGLHHRPLARSQVRSLYTTEMAAGFAVSPTYNERLVAHMHWQHRRPVSSWQDVLTLHRQTGLVPSCFASAFDTLERKDGWPWTL